MATPRAPRKAIGGVDVQLEEFEADLRDSLCFQLVINVNQGFWAEVGELLAEDNRLIEEVIDGCFLDLKHRYQNVSAVMDLLEHCRILIQNVVWAAMNVPHPGDSQAHIEAVVNNALQVYNRVIYAPLRTEMIMANHNAEVLQRTWRRCITDPTHPACRRRLDYEFHDAVRDLNAL
jgi:hypothetical protein